MGRESEHVFFTSDAFDDDRTWRGRQARHTRLERESYKLLVLLSLLISISYISTSFFAKEKPASRVPAHAEVTLARCRALSTLPGPPASYHYRAKSDRFVEGTKDVLLRNATIWTGEQVPLKVGADGRDGSEVKVVRGDVWMSGGIFRGVWAHEEADSVHDMMRTADKNVEVVDAGGKWVTPG